MTGLTFDRDCHTYRLDGHVIPHVTGTIHVLSSYAGVPHDVLQRKAEIGDAVHFATELDDANDLDDDSSYFMTLLPGSSPAPRGLRS